MFDQTCEKCGTRFEPEAVQGLCPCCLIDTGIRLAQEALPEDSPTTPGQTGVAERAELVSFPEGHRLGDYELLEQVGQGGMGAVFKARQISLNRIVAVKMLLAGECASQAAKDRFQAEAESAASLHHPNIVSIYETGEQDGRLYFSMDFVDGQTLAELARKTPLGPLQAARYTQKIAAAVQYAHSKGILHRDLKPGNVLIDDAGEPRITDFGLAKRFEAPPPAAASGKAAGDAAAQPEVPQHLTLSGQVLGSPNFMPPEQASAKWGAVGPQSDVYGLGALLYFLLTGRPPFHAASVTDTLDQVLNAEPGSPRVLNPSVPADLETICLKCLEKELAHRYGRAQDVADELERFLKGEPTQARPLGPAGRTWRWCRRKPALASLGLALAVLGLVIVSGSPIVLARIQRERQRAEAEALRNAKNLYAADMNLAFRALEENHIGQVRDLLARHVPKKGDSDLRDWEWRYLWQESRGDQEFTIGTFSSPVYSVALSPDGSMLAAGDYDGFVKVWDPRSRRLLAQTGPDPNEYPNARTALHFSPDGRRLAVGTARMGSSNFYQLWDTAGWRPETVPSMVHPVQWLLVASRFSPNADQLATATRGSLILWDLREGNRLLEQPVSFYEPYTACSEFSADGRLFAFHSSGTVSVWDLTTQQRLTSIATKSERCLWVTFAPDKTLLAASFWYDPTIQVWSLPEGRLVASFDSSQRWVCALSFTPDGLNLVSAGADRTIAFWDRTSWQRARTLRGHSDEVSRLTYSADGRWLVSGSKDKTVKVWKADSTPREVPFVPYPPDMVPHIWRRAYLGRHGDRFMMARSNGTFRVYSKSSLRLLSEYRLPAANLLTHEMAPGELSPDGRLLACWCADGRLRLFETEHMREAAAFQTRAEGPSHDPAPRLGDYLGQRALAFSPDGKVLATLDNSSMWAWNVQSGTEIMKDDNHNGGGVLTVAFSPDGRWFSSSHYASSTAVIWDLAAKRSVAVLRSGAAAVRDTAIDPSRKWIATVGDEDDVKLWDPLKQTQIASLRGTSTFHLSVAFSPSGRRFATGGGLYVTLWDLTTQREVGVLKSPYGIVVWLEFTDDDRGLLVATETGVFSWRATSFEEIARAEQEQR